jgi:hypothetical protein
MLYNSKLILVEKLLTRWVAEHPGAYLPVIFDNWFTQWGLSTKNPLARRGFMSVERLELSTNGLKGRCSSTHS